MGGYIGSRSVVLSTTAANVQDVTATDTTPEVTIINNTHEDTDGGREGKVIFKGQQSGGEETTLAEIQASHDGTSDDEKGDLIFRTNDGSDGASPTEALRISSDAHIGIGENDPKADLVVKQSGSTFTPNANTVALFQRNTATGSGAMVSILSGNNSAADLNFADAQDEDIGRIRYNHSDNSMQFQTNTAERARIDTSGNLGLGTNSPDVRLHVTDSQEQLTLSEGGSKGATFDYRSSTGNLNIATNGADARANPQMTLDLNGKIGIGTAAPLRQLSIANSTNAEMSFISGTSSNASILFGDGLTGADVYRGYIQYEHSNDAMTFATAATERFRIASNGDLTATDTSIASNSDERLKENIADYSYDIAKFKQYEPKTFDWKNPEAHNGRSGNRGFIAQAVKAIDDKWVGEANVTEENPDYDIISDNVSLTSKLGDKDAMYISVIQQLIAKIETLETQNTTQATQIADLITRVTALEAG